MKIYPKCQNKNIFWPDREMFRIFCPTVRDEQLTQKYFKFCISGEYDGIWKSRTNLQVKEAAYL